MKDVIIIGAGPGGFDAAVYAKEQGLDVLLIEKHIVGGTCLNYGCIPTKALYQVAKNIKNLKTLDVFGIELENYTLSLEKIKQRKEDMVDKGIKNIKQTLKMLQIDFVEGEASFIDQNTVLVNDTKYSAKHIIIATGSKPKLLSFKGSDLEIVKTSKDLLELKIIPKNLVVIGAGVIGLEFANIFGILGSNVTVIEYASNILPSLDQDISKRAKPLFKKNNVVTYTDTRLEEVFVEDNKYFVKVKNKKGKELLLETDMVLVATGRIPNIHTLNYKDIGIEFDGQGIKVNNNKQTNIDHIYAIGDINNENMLAHKATYDGYKAINHILKTKDFIDFNYVPSVVFTFPLIATVGKKEEDCINPIITKYLFKSNAKSESMNETDGFIKLVFEDDVIVGAHIIGTNASDLIHECLIFIQDQKHIIELKKYIHAHPTVSESIAEAIKKYNH